MKKKLLAAILCVVMLVGLLPGLTPDVTAVEEESAENIFSALGMENQLPKYDASKGNVENTPLGVASYTAGDSSYNELFVFGRTYGDLYGMDGQPITYGSSKVIQPDGMQLQSSPLAVKTAIGDFGGVGQENGVAVLYTASSCLYLQFIDPTGRLDNTHRIEITSASRYYAAEPQLLNYYDLTAGDFDGDGQDDIAVVYVGDDGEVNLAVYCCQTARWTRGEDALGWRKVASRVITEAKRSYSTRTYTGTATVNTAEISSKVWSNMLSLATMPQDGGDRIYLADSYFDVASNDVTSNTVKFNLTNVNYWTLRDSSLTSPSKAYTFDILRGGIQIDRLANNKDEMANPFYIVVGGTYYDGKTGTLTKSSTRELQSDVGFYAKKNDNYTQLWSRPAIHCTQVGTEPGWMFESFPGTGQVYRSADSSEYYGHLLSPATVQVYDGPKYSQGDGENCDASMITVDFSQFAAQAANGYGIYNTADGAKSCIYMEDFSGIFSAGSIDTIRILDGGAGQMRGESGSTYAPTTKNGYATYPMQAHIFTSDYGDSNDGEASLYYLKIESSLIWDRNKNGGYNDGTASDTLTATSVGFSLLGEVGFALPDVYADRLTLVYDHYELRYSDPDILAVLASPPYYEDLNLIDGGSNAGNSSTSYSASGGSGSGSGSSRSFSTGAYLSMSSEISVFGISAFQAETELAFAEGLTNSFSQNKERTETITYGTQGGQDTVALYCTPMDVYYYRTYYYDAVTGTTVDNGLVSYSHPAYAPVVSTMSVNDYDQLIAADYGLQPLGGAVIQHEAGVPDSYPYTTSSAYYYSRPVNVGFGNAYTSQDLGENSTKEYTSENSQSFSFSAGAGSGGVVVGITMDMDTSQSKTETYFSGSNYTAEVHNLPTSTYDPTKNSRNLGYNFTWKLAVYESSVKGPGGKLNKFPYVTYILTDVSAPPRLPSDLRVSSADQSTVTLTWTPTDTRDTVRYNIYRAMSGSQDYILVGAAVNGSSFTDTGLYNNINYSYRIESVIPHVTTAGLSVRSDAISAYTHDPFKPLLASSSFSSTEYDPDHDGIAIVPAGASIGLKTIVSDRTEGDQLYFQWQKQDSRGNWQEVLGATEEALQFSDFSGQSAGRFRCKITQVYAGNSSVYYASPLGVQLSGVPSLVLDLKLQSQYGDGIYHSENITATVSLSSTVYDLPAEKAVTVQLKDPNGTIRDSATISLDKFLKTRAATKVFTIQPGWPLGIYTIEAVSPEGYTAETATASFRLLSGNSEIELNEKVDINLKEYVDEKPVEGDIKYSSWTNMGIQKSIEIDKGGSATLRVIPPENYAVASVETDNGAVSAAANGLYYIHSVDADATLEVRLVRNTQKIKLLAPRVNSDAGGTLIVSCGGEAASTSGSSVTDLDGNPITTNVTVLRGAADPIIITTMPLNGMEPLRGEEKFSVLESCILTYGGIETDLTEAMVPYRTGGDVVSGPGGTGSATPIVGDSGKYTTTWYPPEGGIREDITIKAVFKKATLHGLTYHVVDTNGSESGGLNGTISLTYSHDDWAEPLANLTGKTEGSMEIREGSYVHLAAKPADGYAAQWTVNDQPAAELEGLGVSVIGNYCTIPDYTKDMDIRCQFQLSDPGSNVPVYFSPEGNGSIQTSFSIGQNTVDDVPSGASFALGGTLNLTAVPGEGASFTGWDKNGTAYSKETTISYLVAEQTSFTANFEVSSYNMVCGDYVTAVPTSVTHNGSVTFTAEPREGYTLTGWTVNGENTSLAKDSPRELTISPVTKALTVAAVYEATGKYPLTFDESKISVQAGGLPQRSGAEVLVGTELTFNAILSQGQYLKTWAYGGNTSAESTLVCTMPAQAMEVTANILSLITYPVTFDSTTISATVDGIGTSSGKYHPGDTEIVFTYKNPPVGKLAAWSVNGQLQKSGLTFSYTVAAPSAVSAVLVDDPSALKSIAVTTPPDNTEYYVGQYFDPAGMAVTAIYNNGDESRVDDYIWMPKDVLAEEGDVPITVSYTENGITQTATLSLKVNSVGTDTVSTPASSAAAGMYTAEALSNVTLSCTTADVTIYYTTGDAEFSTDTWTQYAQPLNISESCTLRAVAVKETMASSPELRVTYTVGDAPVLKTSLPNATLGQYYNQTIIEAGMRPLTITGSKVGSTEYGLTLNSDGSISGTPNGIPAGNQTVDFGTVTIANELGSDTSPVSVLIDEPTQYTITASSGSGGNISPSGDVLVSEGYNQTFTIAANSGYRISDVLVDGVSVGKTTSYTFREVDAGHSIQATFALLGGGGAGGGGAASTAVTVPASSDEGSVEVEATVFDGTANIAITDTQLDKLIRSDKANGTIRLDVSGLTVGKAAIPANLVAAAADATGSNGLEVEFSIGSVTLDKTALESVGNKSITVSVEDVKATELTEAQKEALGDRADTAIIVDVNILVNGVKTSEFNGGVITVSIPYAPKVGEDTSRLVVWHLADDGAIEPMAGKYDDVNKVYVFTTTHLSTYVLVSFPFTDVANDAYYYDAVLWAVNKGVTSGTTETSFSPDMDCTRAQIATFLWRAMGTPEPASTSCPFTDVASDAYYYKAVLWAAESGITEGTSATTFEPDTTVSRAQVATFLWRAADKPVVNYAMAFTDVPADSYYTEAVRWAVSEGVTSGTSATTFSPSDPCTRAQIVTFLYRYLGK